MFSLLPFVLVPHVSIGAVICMVGSRMTGTDPQALATGVDKLEELGELEMIFGGVSEIGGLERCTSLRTLIRETDQELVDDGRP